MGMTASINTCIEHLCLKLTNSQSHTSSGTVQSRVFLLGNDLHEFGRFVVVFWIGCTRRDLCPKPADGPRNGCGHSTGGSYGLRQKVEAFRNVIRTPRSECKLISFLVAVNISRNAMGM